VTALQIIQEVEAAGGILTLNGDRIQYDVPNEARALVDVLRNHRDEVSQALRGRRDAVRQQVARWISTRCALSQRSWGSEKFLYQRYLAWSQRYDPVPCPRELFGAILTESFHREGNGWRGLCLAADFAASRGCGTKPLAAETIQ
jgi:hypothetical protein